MRTGDPNRSGQGEFQAHPEARRVAVGGCVGEHEAGVVAPGGGGGECQAEPVAGKMAARVEAHEAFEHALPVFRCDAGAAVGHGHAGRTGR